MRVKPDKMIQVLGWLKKKSVIKETDQYLKMISDDLNLEFVVMAAMRWGTLECKACVTWWQEEMGFNVSRLSWKSPFSLYLIQEGSWNVILIWLWSWMQLTQEHKIEDLTIW